jgi:iron complex outermembrane receptor protein
MGSALLVNVAAPPLAAQERSVVPLEEIVVSARRMEERLSDLPTSVTVFDAEDIIKNRFVDLQDYALKTPNINVIDGGTRGQNALSLRGISNQGPTLNQSHAFYIDELNVLAIVGNPQLQDIERIEVLRGPQGTFFGRNAAGGAFNLTTNKPGSEFEANGFASAGSFDTYEVSGTVNVPLTDKLFLRGVGYYHTSDGSVENVNPIGGSDDGTNVHGRVALRFLPTARLTLDLSYTAAFEDNGLDTAVPTGFLRPATRNFFGITQPILDGLPPYPQNTDKVNHNIEDSQDFDYDIVNGRINYQFDHFTITSVTGYGRSARDTVADIERTGQAWFTLFSTVDRELVSEEIRIASTGEGRWRWTIGGIYSSEKYDLDEDVFAEGGNPFFIPAGTNVEDLVIDNDTESWAGFGEVDFRVTDRLTLTYGGRYSTDEAFIHSVFFPFSDQKERESFDNYSNKFAARYDLSEDLSVYFVASEGYRTGGVQFGPVTSFDPETLWNYEGGIKGLLWDGRVRFAATGFHMDWSDMQVVTYVPLPPPAATLITTTDNAAKATSTGAELEFRVKPIDPFEFGFGMGYLDAEFEDYEQASIVGVVGPQDLSGQRQLLSPEWTLNADAQYDFPIGPLDGFVRAEWAYRSSYVTNIIALVPGAVPFFPYNTESFDVWNFRAGVSKGKYALMVYVENAFDNNYYTGTYDSLYVSGVHVRVHPREAGVRLSLSY